MSDAITKDSRAPADPASPGPGAQGREPDPPARGARKRHVLLGWPLRAALSLALVVYLVSSLDWSRLAQLLRAADKVLVAAALLPLGFVPLIAAERWHDAAMALGIRRSRRFFVPATYAALFAGQFLPSGVGVDAVRLALMWRQDVPFASALPSLAIDRMAGVTAVLILMYLGLPFALERLPPGALGPVLLVSVLGAVAGAALLMLDRWPLPAMLRQGRAGQLLAIVKATRAAIARPPTLAALGCGFAIQLVSIFAVLVLAHAFGYSPRFRDLLTVTAFALFAGMLPISFNGWGVREGAMMLGLSLVGVPRDVGLMISFAFGVGGALWSLPGSLTWYHLRHPT